MASSRSAKGAANASAAMPLPSDPFTQDPDEIFALLSDSGSSDVGPSGDEDVSYEAAKQRQPQHQSPLSPSPSSSPRLHQEHHQGHQGPLDNGTGREYKDEERPTYQAGEVDFRQDEARNHAEAEHNLTVRQALRTYRKGIFWCLVVSACVIMEGYDMILIGNFFAYPTFAAKYGQFVDESGQPQLSASWQAALGNSAPIGCLFGSWINGFLVEKYGQKRVLLGSLACLAVFIFITFLAPNVGVLMAGEFLCGLPWGIFASSAPAYASELLPQVLRAYLTSYTNMCFIIGQLISAAVLAGLVRRTDEWAYRIPFALQWLWPAIIFPLLCFAPESPWHLVRAGELKKAEASIRRIQNPSAAVAAGLDPKSTLAFIVRTNELEKTLASGTSTGYMDCFRRDDARRTEIACLSFAAQVLSGSAFAYNSTYFFQQVGLSTGQTYGLNTGGTALALVGTLINWFVLMPRYGRRQIFLVGLLTMAGLLFLIGLLAIGNRGSSAESLSRVLGLLQATLTLLWTLVFQMSIGQLGWAIPTEVSSTRLRQKTVCLARNTYYVFGIMANILQPYLINPHELNMKGYAGFFWFGSATLISVWAFFRLPETKGRNYDELDWLFAKKTPARKFATTNVGDVFARSKNLGRITDDQGDDNGRYGVRNEDEDAHEMDVMVHQS